MSETRDVVQSAEAQPITEDRIRIRAYELYEKRHGEAGDPESDWYRAETELKETTAEAAK